MKGKIIYELNRLLKRSRNFASKPIDKETLKKILDAGTYAPYGLNPPQPWKFIGILGNKALSISRKLDSNSSCVVLCFSPKVKDYYNQLTNFGSTFASIYNMVLQAISYGITYDIVFQVNEELKESIYRDFNIKNEEYILSAIVFFGYSAQKVEPKQAQRNVIWRIE
ncbi:MAG: nitroreductase family protein [candidate division WOR-3 bacterium]|nr:nitroreductase family protein [candidate division WOR-3 bacterium]MCX7947974.1 nitroreductase family protein [candidate division WOR-3 bacterium]MDW8150918.1 nitroreductase family protein [candidate division WOR-3 bacterium]